MDFKEILEEIAVELSVIKDTGEIASYIPELSRVDPTKFGVSISTIDGESYGYGDHAEKFSIQSIAKVFALVAAYRILGTKVWERVGVEPSGTSFNSLGQLEHDRGIPRNPFINSGAIVIADILYSMSPSPKEEFINFVRDISCNRDIYYNSKIARSEKSVGFRNVALINLLKSFGNIDNNVEDVLDFYFNICSIEMSCNDLSKAFLFLANDGKSLCDNEEILSISKSKRLNAIMQMCGFYDEAGEFSFKVGLPGKSGVGGGIVAVNPDSYTIAVWSPKLNAKGNSFKGMKFLELFTTKTECSIF